MTRRQNQQHQKIRGDLPQSHLLETRNKLPIDRQHPRLRESAYKKQRATDKKDPKHRQPKGEQSQNLRSFWWDERSDFRAEQNKALVFERPAVQPGRHSVPEKLPIEDFREFSRIFRIFEKFPKILKKLVSEKFLFCLLVRISFRFNLADFQFPNFLFFSVYELLIDLKFKLSKIHFF